MRAGRASRTAQHNALFRSLETALPRRARLFADPLARAFLTWPLTPVAWLGRVPGLRVLLLRYIDGRWPGVRTSVVARTRLIDDTLGALLSGGEGPRPAQLVLLGAGYDTRPHRLGHLDGVTTFEVDHPDTQAAKRRVLARALPSPPPGVRYVAVDFDRDDLGERMVEAGFTPAVPSVILWEGVTNYLTEAGVVATLQWCARAGRGSQVIFTYVHRDVITNPERFAGTDQLYATLARAGEQLTFGLDPAELPAFLGRCGLVLEQDVGAADYRRRYYGDRADRMKGHEFYRLAVARVAA